MIILNAHATENLPAQRMDQLIYLADEVLLLLLVFATVGSLVQRAHAVAVVAHLGQGIRDGVVEGTDCHSLLDVGIQRGCLLSPRGMWS